jgi:hypothetical protein
LLTFCYQSQCTNSQESKNVYRNYSENAIRRWISQQTENGNQEAGNSSLGGYYKEEKDC